jgi:hypothetical protein
MDKFATKIENKIDIIGNAEEFQLSPYQQFQYLGWIENSTNITLQFPLKTKNKNSKQNKKKKN